MSIIGITGSSGSGKTKISSIFKEKYSAKIVDADEIVKQLTVPGTEYMNAIKENVGTEFFYEDGNLNKKKLSEEIYHNETSLKELNKLTFKYVVEEMKRRVYESKENVIVIDAPLLIEAGLDRLCDYIIAVLADKEVKINRICIRDNLDRKTAESRLKIQKEDDFYIKYSNFIIYNNGKENLEENVENIMKNINK